MKSIKHLPFLFYSLICSSLYSTTASADCSPDPVAPGGTVTCTGVDSDGFASIEDNVIIDIDVAATVNEGPGVAIGLSGGNALVNLDGRISTSTAGAAGINIEGMGGRINFGVGASIQTTGPTLFSPGIRVSADGARIDMAANSSITTSASVGIGLLADDAVIDIAPGVTIDTNGRFGHSILALNQSDFTVNVAQGATLITRGLDARGINLQASNSTVNLDGAVITNGGQLASGSGDGSIGVIIGDSNFFTTGGELNIGSTGSILTNGDGAFGVVASGASTTVNIADGATVTATGGPGAADGFPAGGVATNATNGIVNNAGIISANPATFSLGAAIGGDSGVFNNQPTGVINGGLLAVLFIGGPASTATLNNQNIISGGILGEDAGNQIINNSGSIDAAFNGGFIELDDGDDRIDNSGTLTGQISMGQGTDQIVIEAGSDISAVPAMNGGDDADAADGFIDSISFNSYVGSVGDLLNWESINITAGAAVVLAGSSYTGGETVIDADSTLDMGSGTQSLGSALQITAGVLEATGNGAGDFSIGGDVSNSAAINTADGQPGDTLTIAGNYSGSGAEIILDTTLDDGGSASTDAIVIEGDTSGVTLLNIANAGGAGGLTGTGPNDGILVVEVRGVSAPGAFALSAPLTAGSFTYDLVQADGQNWYLQSSASVGPTPPGGAEPIPAINIAMLFLMICGLVLLGVRRI